MSSAEVDSSHGKNLLSVKYYRVQKASPDFTTVYEGIDQSVDVTISTVIFRAAPEPVLTLYDFVMTTFVPKSEPPVIQPTATDQIPSPDSILEQSPKAGGSSEKIRVMVKLDSVQSESVDNLRAMLQLRYVLK